MGKFFCDHEFLFLCISLRSSEKVWKNQKRELDHKPRGRIAEKVAALAPKTICQWATNLDLY